MQAGIRGGGHWCLALHLQFDSDRHHNVMLDPQRCETHISNNHIQCQQVASLTKLCKAWCSFARGLTNPSCRFHTCMTTHTNVCTYCVTVALGHLQVQQRIRCTSVWASATLNVCHWTCRSCTVANSNKCTRTCIWDRVNNWVAPQSSQVQAAKPVQSHESPSQIAGLLWQTARALWHWKPSQIQEQTPHTHPRSWLGVQSRASSHKTALYHHLKNLNELQQMHIQTRKYFTAAQRLWWNSQHDTSLPLNCTSVSVETQARLALCN